jgi:hypothetical protein
MSPFDEDSEEAREDSARDADGEALGAEQQPNIVIGPLTDGELEAGGMERTVAFIRTTKSKAALRQAKRRAKKKLSNLSDEHRGARQRSGASNHVRGGG